MGGMVTLQNGTQQKANLFDYFGLAARMKNEGRKLTEDEARQWFPLISEKKMAKFYPKQSQANSQVLGGGSVAAPEKTADSAKPAEPLTRPRNTAGGFFGMLGG